MARQKTKTVMLIILDGFGIAAPNESNCIYQAKTPNLINLYKSYPTMSLLCNKHVIGNSLDTNGSCEKSHFSMGTGQIDYHDYDLVENFIDEIATNNQLKNISSQLAKSKNNLHLMGVLSDNKVVSHTKHLFLLLDYLKQKNIANIYLHLIMDGIDATNNSGIKYVAELQKHIKSSTNIKIASIVGRDHVMSQNYSWDNLHNYYQVLFQTKTTEPQNINQILNKSYKQEIFDNKIPAQAIDNFTIKQDDSLILFNFDNTNLDQLITILAKNNFSTFERSVSLKNIYSLTDTNECQTIFKQPTSTSIGEILNKHNLKQYYISWADKAGMINYFFHGKNNLNFTEKKEFIFPDNSLSFPKEFKNNSKKFNKIIIKELLKRKHDFMVVNYPYADLAAHTGNQQLTTKAIEILDKNIGELVNYIISKNITAIIVGDHGNAEQIIDLASHKPSPYHSANPVPAILIGPKFEGKNLATSEVIENDLSTLSPEGFIFDIAPTILKIFDIKQPKEMIGKPLF